MQSESSQVDRVTSATEHIEVSCPAVAMDVDDLGTHVVDSGDEYHPGWCSAEHCYRTDHGVRVHLQAPSRWEDDQVRFETELMSPEDETTTYLELHIEDLRLPWRCVNAYLSVPAAHRLRDRLNAHLDAAACGGPAIGDE